jgi:hypothetical protein
MDVAQKHAHGPDPRVRGDALQGAISKRKRRDSGVRLSLERESARQQTAGRYTKILRAEGVSALTLLLAQRSQCRRLVFP